MSGCNRFLQEHFHIHFRKEFLKLTLIYVKGGEETDVSPTIALLDLPIQFEAIHPRHPDVSDDQVVGAFM